MKTYYLTILYPTSNNYVSRQHDGIYQFTDKFGIMICAYPVNYTIIYEIENI